MDEVPYTVIRRSGETCGGDVVIALSPEEIETFRNLVPGALVIGGPMTGWLAQLGDLTAQNLGVQFARGEFVFTTDPDVVREFGSNPEHPDCEQCLEGITLALAQLELEPERTLVVGRLLWTA